MSIFDHRPPFGRIKIIEMDFYSLVLDCTGAVQPMSYCEAVKMLKNLGFLPEERGTGQNGKHFETWRLPKEQDTRQHDKTV